jgi:hypothetical protein
MGLFDSEGRVVDREALRSVQIASNGPRRPVTTIDRDRDVKIVESVRDDNGATAGFHTHHASGRVDCDVFAETARTSVTS